MDGDAVRHLEDVADSIQQKLSMSRQQQEKASSRVGELNL
jgi:hypothetical protein